MPWNDGNDDEDEDYTGFDTSDAEEETTAECPHCGEMIYDDAERCPECGEYLSSATAGRKPAWVIAGVVVCLLIVLLWVLGGLF
jgi:uncharacterized protein (DUF983 family)